MNFGWIADSSLLNVSKSSRYMLLTRCSDLQLTIYLYIYIPFDGLYKSLVGIEFKIIYWSIRMNLSDCNVLESTKLMCHGYR